MNSEQITQAFNLLANKPDNPHITYSLELILRHACTQFPAEALYAIAGIVSREPRTHTVCPTDAPPSEWTNAQINELQTVVNNEGNVSAVRYIWESRGWSIHAAKHTFDKMADKFLIVRK